MKKSNFYNSIMLSTLCLFGTLIFAASAIAADVKAGEKKASACTNCHGLNGISVDAQFPVLAGQRPEYIVKQLKAFKSGSRQGPIMKNMAQGLSDEDMTDLAAYFSSLQPRTAVVDPKLAELGEKQSAMCLGCHGKGAEGRMQFPRLAGQHPDYLAKQLKAFKSGTRKGSPMNAIAKNLSEEDIEALAAYLGSL
ncbi:c-type cytochrome [Methylotuvimicrobium alcaliphilum]|uniref:Cytochrome c class I n=1 Tax=Methylotuvimicrobium alcaliphilum (strain DSM 19304 / NCIMB 14124 / VKM B-2133 / 20Z) TaxID=1091494 RepID=G4STY8_META2|nr:cytochrome c [Methylotuvimicrobium alcaliphilum]CCE22811.1 Cytochrome c class I [Methylotuvimicrobium alcaliphilum 20Z]